MYIYFQVKTTFTPILISNFAPPRKQNDPRIEIILFY
jgi:hypothetical protein